MKTYATFSSKGRCAFDESDCQADTDDSYSICYDANGIGHVLRRNLL